MHLIVADPSAGLVSLHAQERTLRNEQMSICRKIAALSGCTMHDSQRVRGERLTRADAWMWHRKPVQLGKGLVRPGQCQRARALDGRTVALTWALADPDVNVSGVLVLLHRIVAACLRVWDRVAIQHHLLPVRAVSRRPQFLSAPP